MAGKIVEVALKIISIIFVALLLSPFAFASDDIKTAARAAVSKWEKAVITVKIVAKMKTGRGDEENQFEVTGTVIDPSGLTVVSAQSIDPASMIKGFLMSMGRGEPPDASKLDSQITQTTMIMQDGSEIDAEVVLKDAELDFAFVRPRESEQHFVYIPLNTPSKSLELLQDLFVISRMNRAENRATGITLGMVQSIVKGPRTVYITNQELVANSLGCIAFSADGLPVGIVVTKAKQNTGDKGMAVLMNMMMGSGIGGAGSFTVLRPIDDLMEDLTQAKETKAAQTQ